MSPTTDPITGARLARSTGAAPRTEQGRILYATIVDNDSPDDWGPIAAKMIRAVEREAAAPPEPPLDVEALRLLRLAEKDYNDGLTEPESEAFIADVRAFLAASSTPEPPLDVLRDALVELHAAAVEMFDGITSHGQAIRRAEAALNEAAAPPEPPLDVLKLRLAYEGGRSARSFEETLAAVNQALAGGAASSTETSVPTDEQAERWLEANDLIAVTHFHESPDCGECAASAPTPEAEQ